MTRPDVPAGSKGSFWRTARAVAWGFFGVRRDKDYQEDIAKLSPLHIVAMGFVGVLLFIGLLIVLVKFAVAS
ncbi:DUF2970 domain-containing protein [Variovorax ginsengisoli]|uniref:DUF2970 domain-containing protein n=1 Tax=Variovorax ginsengisoli TaxID=363844 RepID=A0ABT9S8E6_9BURK|nr:DUF2970 domain-containing protein [Variovorax ginsengisoli]MDP9900626.1 hypothetical protein [Variovorax ginsengisoli]